MPKTTDQLRQEAIQILKRGISLNAHKCSLCKCPLRFVWINETPGRLGFDSACDCVRYSSNINPCPENYLDPYLEDPYFLNSWGILNEE